MRIYYQMPCSKCKQTGHNARTCQGTYGSGPQSGQLHQRCNPNPSLTEEAVIVAVPPVIPVKIKRFYCYILGQTNFLRGGKSVRGVPPARITATPSISGTACASTMERSKEAHLQPKIADHGNSSP